jgi:hypothetical protein
VAPDRLNTILSEVCLSCLSEACLSEACLSEAWLSEAWLSETRHFGSRPPRTVDGVQPSITVA